MYKYSKRTHEVFRFVGYVMEMIEYDKDFIEVMKIFLTSQEKRSFVESRKSFLNNEIIQKFLQIF